MANEAPRLILPVCKRTTCEFCALNTFHLTFADGLHCERVSYDRTEEAAVLNCPEEAFFWEEFN